MIAKLTVKNTLPDDDFAGTLVGRVWSPEAKGPLIVCLHDGQVFNISSQFSTMSDLLNSPDPLIIASIPKGQPIGSVEELLANSSFHTRDENLPWLLSPIDLQTIKASGVTFAASLIERVIEEKAMGNPAVADDIRKMIVAEIGTSLSQIKPGSQDARRIKEVLIERDMWSQYLEVGIGEFAEIFTKAPTMASVGTGMQVGIHPLSTWNNPEPEVVLVVNNEGTIVGATLGNDVNLRDFEGRSALLLGKAKDNNASASLGPFIRLLDATFSMDDIRTMELGMEITGEDGYQLSDGSSMKFISRDIEDLVGQTISDNHQYPDGFVLYTGTMFAPKDDRGEKGAGFTHKPGDIVAISSSKLGTLVNQVAYSNQADKWTFGIGSLMKNLAERGLL